MPFRCFCHTALGALALTACAPTASASPEWPAISGLVQFDAAMHAEDELAFSNDLDARRADLRLSGEISSQWAWYAEYDLAREDSALREIWLAHRLAVGELRVGQLRVPQGLERQMDPEHRAFLEPSAATDLFTDGDRLGVGHQLLSRHYGVQSMLFSRAVGDDPSGDAPLGAAVRGYIAPFNWPGELFHAGLSLSYEDRRDEGVERAAWPDSRSTDAPLMTASIPDGDTVLRGGAELAVVSGPFSAGFEYHGARIGSDDSDDPLLTGFNTQLAYVLTGESRDYRDGAFAGISPRNRLGAWEVALRFSNVNLDDSDLRQGVQNTAALALNWYANDQVRVMFNAVYADIEESPVALDQAGEDDPVVVDDESLGMALMRLQFRF